MASPSPSPYAPCYSDPFTWPTCAVVSAVNGVTNDDCEIARTLDENDCDGSVFLTLTDNQLKVDLEIRALGKRVRVMRLIENLRRQSEKYQLYYASTTTAMDLDENVNTATTTLTGKRKAETGADEEFKRAKATEEERDLPASNIPRNKIPLGLLSKDQTLHINSPLSGGRQWMDVLPEGYLAPLQMETFGNASESTASLAEKRRANQALATLFPSPPPPSPQMRRIAEPAREPALNSSTRPALLGHTETVATVPGKEAMDLEHETSDEMMIPDSNLCPKTTDGNAPQRAVLSPPPTPVVAVNDERPSEDVPERQGMITTLPASTVQSSDQGGEQFQAPERSVVETRNSGSPTEDMGKGPSGTPSRQSLDYRLRCLVQNRRDKIGVPPNPSTTSPFHHAEQTGASTTASNPAAAKSSMPTAVGASRRTVEGTNDLSRCPAERVPSADVARAKQDAAPVRQPDATCGQFTVPESTTSTPPANAVRNVAATERAREALAVAPEQTDNAPLAQPEDVGRTETAARCTKESLSTGVRPANTPTRVPPSWSGVWQEIALSVRRNEALPSGSRGAQHPQQAPASENRPSGAQRIGNANATAERSQPIVGAVGGVEYPPSTQTTSTQPSSTQPPSSQPPSAQRPLIQPLSTQRPSIQPPFTPLSSTHPPPADGGIVPYNSMHTRSGTGQIARPASVAINGGKYLWETSTTVIHKTCYSPGVQARIANIEQLWGITISEVATTVSPAKYSPTFFHELCAFAHAIPTWGIAKDVLRDAFLCKRAAFFTTRDLATALTKFYGDHVGREKTFYTCLQIQAEIESIWKGNLRRLFGTELFPAAPYRTFIVPLHALAENVPSFAEAKKLLVAARNARLAGQPLGKKRSHPLITKDIEAAMRELEKRSKQCTSGQDAVDGDPALAPRKRRANRYELDTFVVEDDLDALDGDEEYVDSGDSEDEDTSDSDADDDDFDLVLNDNDETLSRPPPYTRSRERIAREQRGTTIHDKNRSQRPPRPQKQAITAQQAHKFEVKRLRKQIAKVWDCQGLKKKKRKQLRRLGRPLPKTKTLSSHLGYIFPSSDRDGVPSWKALLEFAKETPHDRERAMQLLKETTGGKRRLTIDDICEARLRYRERHAGAAQKVVEKDPKGIGTGTWDAPESGDVPSQAPVPPPPSTNTGPQQQHPSLPPRPPAGICKDTP